MEDCVSTKTSAMWVQFYSYELDTIYRVDSVYAYSDKTLPLEIEDSIITAFPFFLDPASDSVKYNFDIVVLDTDTTTARYDSLFFHVRYTRRQRVISLDCGVEHAFYDLEFSNHNFDSLVIVTDTVDRFNDVNVKVYF